jgi:hypothetical protein
MSTRALKSVVVGAVLVAVAAGISSQAVSGAPPKLKRNIKPQYATFKIPVGDVRTVVVGCPTGTDAVSGGYQLSSGNFMYVLTSSVAFGGEGYVFTALVPNKIAAAGVLPALGKLKVLCATEGEPVVP